MASRRRCICASALCVQRPDLARGKGVKVYQERFEAYEGKPRDLEHGSTSFQTRGMDVGTR